MSTRAGDNLHRVKNVGGDQYEVGIAKVMHETAQHSQKEISLAQSAELVFNLALRF